MENVIKAARELGKAIQQDERYKAVLDARLKSDEDTALQEAIGLFNLKRMQINNEAMKDERDDDKIAVLNDELKQAYTAIMKNDNYILYNEAKAAFDAMMKRVNAIVAQCSEGEDPETTDLTEADCGGSCATCAGCH